MLSYRGRTGKWKRKIRDECLNCATIVIISRNSGQAHRLMLQVITQLPIERQWNSLQSNQRKHRWKTERDRLKNDALVQEALLRWKVLSIPSALLSLKHNQTIFPTSIIQVPFMALMQGMDFSKIVWFKNYKIKIPFSLVLGCCFSVWFFWRKSVLYS